MVDLVLYIIITSLLILLYKQFGRNKQKGKTIPGPKGLPFLGKAIDISPSTIHELLSQYATDYGEIVQIKVAGDTLVVLNKCELLYKAFTGIPYKRILNDRPEYYYGKTFMNGSQSLGFTLDANAGAHSIMRKCFTKALHMYGDGIKVFEESILREIKTLTDTMDRKEGEDIEVIGILKRSITGILTNLLCGQKMTDEDLSILSAFFASLEGLMNFHNNAILNSFPFLVRVPGYYKNIHDRCYDAKEKVSQRFFQQMKDSYKPGEVRGVVDFFMEEQMREKEAGGDVVWTDEQIIGNVLDLFAAGTLTTLSAMSSTILCLAHHPEYQMRVQEELDNVLGEGRPPVLEDRPLCPVLEAAILETLRYLPSLPLLQIHTSAKDIEFEGYHLPAGSMVIPNAWYILHDEAVWGDPWVFRPERFLDENGALLPASHPLRKQWIPFGIGRRQCVAEQFARSRLFLFLASLFQRYNFTPADGGRGGNCDPRGGTFDFSVLCRSKPFYCQIEKRHGQN